MFQQNWINNTTPCPEEPATELLVVDLGNGQFQFTVNTSGGQTPYAYAWSVSPETGFTNNTGDLVSDNLDITINISGTYRVEVVTTEAGGGQSRAIKSISFTVVEPSEGIYSSPYDSNYA